MSIPLVKDCGAVAKHMATDEHPHAEALSDIERDALHEVELGIEHLHRAHGHLVAFHHSTGRAMDRLAASEDLLREAGFSDAADTLRDEYLHRGVIECGDRDNPTNWWSYEVLENYENVFLDDMVAFGQSVREEIAGGLRHAHEREQEREWKERAREGRGES